MHYRSDNLERGELVGIEELSSRAEECGGECTECGLKSRSANPDRADDAVPIPAEEC